MRAPRHEPGSDARVSAAWGRRTPAPAGPGAVRPGHRLPPRRIPASVLQEQRLLEEASQAPARSRPPPPATPPLGVYPAAPLPPRAPEPPWLIQPWVSPGAARPQSPRGEDAGTPPPNGGRGGCGGSQGGAGWALQGTSWQPWDGRSPNPPQARCSPVGGSSFSL